MHYHLLTALLVAFELLLSACQPPAPLARALEDLGFTVQPKAVRFAVIGDSGTGYTAQYEIGDWMQAYHEVFPFDFVIMLGDNLYGGFSTTDYEAKFRLPYKPLLDKKVAFYAALGNHDSTAETFFVPFHMGGERFYAFTKGNARFFVLDSTYLDAAQLRWLEKELRATDTDWKIVYMHHPIYSAGSYHSVDPELRRVLEPLFLKYGVDVVFSGHEHFYERLQPQHGITYFTSGAAGKLHHRKLTQPYLSAAGYDADLHFMLIEIAGDDLAYRAISRTGKVVDSGVLQRTSHPAGEARTPTPLRSQRLSDPRVERASE
ncbi:MAG: Calcineurin-like phosphoesterase [Deltaproteobacteria bacterium]|nr:Calcineurin-like phosphoesterase [Deltaproteobacteria bacterium]